MTQRTMTAVEFKKLASKRGAKSAKLRAKFAGVPTAPAGARACNPAFDVTPAANITAIVTEVGVLRPPYAGALRAACEEGTCIS